MKKPKPHPLVSFRRSRSMQQQELARRAGISGAYLCIIEKGGSFSIDAGLALVRATGEAVSLNELAKARKERADDQTK